MLDILSLQTALVEHAWPSGFEQSMGAYLKELVRPYVDEVWIDRMGNVICHKKGPGKKILFPAHMDVLGLLVLYVDEAGYAHFDTNGGFDTTNLLSAPFVAESGAAACVRAMGKSKPADKAIDEMRDRDDLYIDIGTSNREETLKYLDAGSVLKYATKPMLLANDKMATPYADDLACCVTMILAMEELKEKSLENDCYFVFTVQEEVGLRGAGAAAYAIEPDVCIVLDGTHTNDSLSDHGKVGNKLGAGACIKLRDSSLICNPQVIDFLHRVAEANDIRYQDEIMIGGGTDGEVVQKSRAGVLTSGISLAMRNIHSPYETIDINDVKACAQLIAAAAMTRFE